MASTYPPSGTWYTRDLVGRVRGRDEAAFAELYERYYPRIYQYFLRRLGGDSPEAEDLAAGVFTRVFEKIEHYQLGVEPAPFASWLFRIAHNHFIDHVRRRQGRPVEPLTAAAEVRDPEASAIPDRLTMAREIEQALGQLTPEQRQAVVLRFVKGLSTAETAEALGRTEEAAKKLQARGLGALRRALDCPSGCWRIPGTQSP